jgi:hypothetical protein
MKTEIFEKKKEEYVREILTGDVDLIQFFLLLLSNGVHRALFFNF